jgi:secreted PhoX family phosphatase
MTMRKVDARVKVTRRQFLQTSATAAPAATLLAGGTTLGSEAAWAQASTLSPHAMATLTLMARDTYPHDQLGDSYYRSAVAHWDDDAAADVAKRQLIANGVVTLDAEANARFGMNYIDVPSEADRVTILQAIEPGAFFKAVRADLVVSIYNQKKLWPKFGYEGASAQYGGYLHRGFNDIDWLPTT